MPIPKRSAMKGFLQRESGTILDYRLHAHEGVAATTGRPYLRLSVELTLKRDSNPQPIRQFLSAGFLQPGVSVSSDGKSLVGLDQYAVDPATEWGKFVTSLFENRPGEPDRPRLPEELYGDGCNYEAWMGARCLFDRVIDKEATDRRGPEVSKLTGQHFDRRQLLVLEVLTMPPALKKKKAAPVTSKPLAASTAATDETDVAALDQVLSATLANLPNQTINRKGLGTAFLKLSSKLGQTGAARDIPRRVFASDEYLLGAAERGVIDFDGSDDGQITLLAVNTPF